MKKRSWMRLFLIALEACVLGAGIWMLCQQSSSATALFLLAAAIAYLLYRSFASPQDARLLAQVEKVWQPYLQGVFTQHPARRRRLLTALLETMTTGNSARTTFASLRRKATTPRECAALDFFLARAQAKDGRTAEAEQTYRAAVAAEPGFSSAWANLGVLLQGSGRYEEAEECLLRAVQTDETSAIKHSNLANLYLSLHRAPDAVREAARAMELDPKLPEACIARTLAEELNGDSSRANHYARACVKLGVGEEWIYATLKALRRGDLSVLSGCASPRAAAPVKGEKTP